MENIITAYKDTCNALAARINKVLFCDNRDWYWVGEEVGGLCDFCDTDFLTPTDMVLLLQNNVTYEQYAEWRDANIEYAEVGHINLHSWLMGCRHDMLDKAKRGE